MYYAFIILFFRVESKIEKHFRKKEQNQKVEYEEIISIKLFNYFQALICILSSIEFFVISESRNLLVLNMSVGFFLVIGGIYLRIKAIETLGIYWSYNVKILFNHRIIHTGIYKYIKHPAYLGNIYILGIFLVTNLYFSILISFVFLSVFNIWRINKENKLLSEIECLEKERKYKFTTINIGHLTNLHPKSDSKLI